MHAIRAITLMDPATQTQLRLPVTPESFQVSHGTNIEMVNIHTLGEVAVAGYGTLPTFQINCMFPANQYHFNYTITYTDDPYYYIEMLESWCDNRTVLRFIVNLTIVDAPVLIKEIVYGEKDGTNDIYATITLQKYRVLPPIQADNTGNSARGVDAPPDTAETYTIQAGDTLSAICRDKYGDSSLYSSLASYNGIKNPNLIYAGSTLELPDKSLL